MMTPRAATSADFAFIRGLAGHPDYAPFITDEDEAALALYRNDPSARLQIWQENGQPAGFALYCEIGHPSGRVELRRLALARTGGGRGLAFVTALTDHAFETLDASGENARAARVYDQAGYRLEGVQRGHWWRPALGRSVDLLLYGLMRAEWQARRR
jgi:RimJ/RimL family protein N-acetyltransferase